MTKKKYEYPGFWAVMPKRTRIAFISFFVGKFVWCPLSVLFMFVSNTLAKISLGMWGLCIVIAVGFSIAEMYGKEQVPARHEVEKWAKHYNLKG